MVIEKLKETLEAVHVQQEQLSEVEAQLISMIAKLSGNDKASVEEEPQEEEVVFRRPGRDRIDDITDILRISGEPVHVTELARALSERTGKQINRTQIEPGINRHIAKTKVPRIAKFAPSTYGLPEWKKRPEYENLLDSAA